MDEHFGVEAPAEISTHAPAGGATVSEAVSIRVRIDFYSRPCGRGDTDGLFVSPRRNYFYSRPCGRGDSNFPQVRHEVLRQIAER